jgi:hypothetical protein
MILRIGESDAFSCYFSILFYSLADTFIRQPIDQSMTLCIHMPAMGPSAVRTMLARAYWDLLGSQKR